MVVEDDERKKGDAEVGFLRPKVVDECGGGGGGGGRGQDGGNDSGPRYMLKRPVLVCVSYPFKGVSTFIFW